MIYPQLKDGTVIGVTAASAGVGPDYKDSFEQALDRVRGHGFGVVLGDTVYRHHKTRSASGKVRGEELNRMMADPGIGMIFPPWGGELLLEMMEYIDFGQVQPKWVMGFSDISLLLLAVTLNTGIATAHSISIGDLAANPLDVTSARWLEVLRTGTEHSVVQQASHEYRTGEPGPEGRRGAETQWLTLSGGPETLRGRLLGGCIDVIRHLVGTPYGDVAAFRRQHIHGEPILWYLENCELNAADLRRSLLQMKLSGWFEGSSGILFGRSEANRPVDGYTADDVYRELAEELGVPIAYDLDFGHVPPQVTLVNGAYAEVQAGAGTGRITQWFKA